MPAPVAGSAPILSAYLPKSMNGMALTKKIKRTAIASKVTTVVTVNESSTPRTLSPTNNAYRLIGGRRIEDRRQVSANEEDDHGGRQHIFDILRNPGDVAGPGSKRGSREGIGAAGVRQGRAHFRDRIGEAEIHKGDENGTEEHAAPAADRESKVPAGEIARDDGGNAERPQIKDAGVAPELPVLEIAYVDVTIGNATFIPLNGHYAFLFLYSARRVAMRTLEGP